MKVDPVLKFSGGFTAVGECTFNLLYNPMTYSECLLLLFYFYTFSNLFFII